MKFRTILITAAAIAAPVAAIAPAKADGVIPVKGNAKHTVNYMIAGGLTVATVGTPALADAPCCPSASSTWSSSFAEKRVQARAERKAKKKAEKAAEAQACAEASSAASAYEAGACAPKA